MTEWSHDMLIELYEMLQRYMPDCRSHELIIQHHLHPPPIGRQQSQRLHERSRGMKIVSCTHPAVLTLSTSQIKNIRCDK